VTAAAHVFRRALPGGGELLIGAGAELPGLAREDLLVSLQVHPTAIAAALSRDDVRDLVQALDDWLYDSRPT
jgi:hypothetical protein